MDAVAADTVDGYEHHVNRGMARLLRLAGTPVEASASGSIVLTTDGRRLLDAGGYSVFLLGHRHPDVVAAVEAQLRRMPLSTRLLASEKLASAAAALAASAPPGLEYVMFASAGAEAIEAALKLARMNGFRTLVACEGAYHGKTLGALSATGSDRYRVPFEPLLPGVTRVPFDDVDATTRAVEEAEGPCAVIVEPIQSEAGVLIPSAGYLAALGDLRERTGCALIVDEISTGLGRTGSLWETAAAGVEADVLVCGKALGGGVIAVSALIANERMFAGLNRDPFLHTSTFAGNPLACAATLATLEVIARDDVPGRARELGRRIAEPLEEVVAELREDGFAVELRAAGLLLGLEFKAEHLAAEMLIELIEREVLACHSLNGHRTVRLTPPVTLTDAEVGWLTGAVGEALGVVAARNRRPLEARR